MPTKTYNGTGADCSGNSGDKNRVLTLPNINMTQQDGMLVYVSGLALALNIEYTVEHKENGTKITFINRLWDDMTIVVLYVEVTKYGKTVYGKLRNGIDKLMKYSGYTSLVKVITYTIPTGSYDDYTVQSVTGSQYISGLIFPVRASQGSEEALLLEQGKIQTKDKVLYTGSFSISGNLLFDIQGDKYAIIPNGIHTWTSAGSTIYNKIYLRYATAGSLY